jgi:ubiquinone/menaquinone biosynthesis C-methylase UbiE
MKAALQLTADEQTAVLADLYSQRAEVYDTVWSPVIRPIGERLLGHLPLAKAEAVIDIGTGAGALLPSIQRHSSRARVLGVDRSEGMLRLSRQKFSGPLALMDVQRLGLRAERFDVAVVAFVLFHLPNPKRCLKEVNRVLKPDGRVGTVTWGREGFPPANAVWDEELEAAGAAAMELPATDNRSSCNSVKKMTALLKQAGFVSIKAWCEPVEHRWRPEVHFDYHIRSSARERLKSPDSAARDACLGRVRDRLSGAGEEQYLFKSEVVMTTAVRPAARGGQ